jgi:GNAT superfamily N-acetyltransferase
MPAGSVLVRSAVRADVALIVGWIRGLAEYEKLSHEVEAETSLLAEHLFGERRFCEAFIAEIDAEPVGYCLFFHSYSTFLTRPGIYLEDLFVVPERRGSGAGRALLSRLAELTVERGCARLEWAVLDWNEPAIGFYRGIGAVPADDWTSYRLTGPALKRLAGAED